MEYQDLFSHKKLECCLLLLWWADNEIMDYTWTSLYNLYTLDRTQLFNPLYTEWTPPHFIRRVQFQF